MPSGSVPAGYYKTADWSVSSVDWHGCVWTGIDSTVSGSTTSITPQDFTAVEEGGPYEVSGSVYKDYNAVAMIGFNIAEEATSSADQCKHNTSTTDQPPEISMPSSATGIAVSWGETTAPPTSFRIQLQSKDGNTNADHRWCATITDAGGPSFIKFSDMYTSCWNVGVSGKDPGAAFDPTTDKVTAVSFLVPGTTSKLAPFDFTINGFAPGTSSSDAPSGGTKVCGKTAGTLGSTTASEAASMQRVKVTGTDCKQYIIQNNNWGNKTGSTQTIDYTGNSFTVKTSTGSGSSAPASFPSIYVGANGDLANGTYNTWSDTGLPAKISAIKTAKTTYKWGSKTGSFNATYDVWFSKSSPTAGSYNDAISGFLMVWLYKPGDKQPIGSVKRTATLAGHTWNVWVGPRGDQSTGTDDSSRPVVSYVAQDSPVSSLDFDLKDFMSDAVTNGSSDMSAGGTSQAFSDSWYLTDVFGGFEIWSGGDGVGLNLSNFSFAITQ